MPPPPPTTLDEALDRLAYGDRGVIDRPAHLAFIRAQIAAAVADERKACAAEAAAVLHEVLHESDGGSLAAHAAEQILTAIRARGAR